MTIVTNKFGSTMKLPEESQVYCQFPPSVKWGTFATHQNHLPNLQDTICGQCNFTPDPAKDVLDFKATCHKFTLNWSQILPEGTLNKINKAGLDSYNNLINTLLDNKIEPIVSLHDSDIPQTLLEKCPEGWLDRNVTKAFSNYARLCFKLFGDRVKYWVTIDDPWKLSHIGGSAVDKSSVGFSPKVFRSLMNAHKLAYSIYEKEFKHKQNGKVGISVNSKCISSSERNCFQVEKAVLAPSASRKLGPTFNSNPNPTSEQAPNCWLEFRETHSEFVHLINEDIHKINPSKYINITNTRSVLNVIKKDLQNPEIFICGKDSPLIAAGTLVNMNTEYFRAQINEVLKAVVLDGCNVAGFLPVNRSKLQCRHVYRINHDRRETNINQIHNRIQGIMTKYLTKSLSYWLRKTIVL